MGNLTADQLSSIVAGEAIRQRWYVQSPIDAAHTVFLDSLFESGVFTQDHRSATDVLSRVTKAGRRRHVVWNPSPHTEMQAEALRYSFEVANGDGQFNLGAGKYWDKYSLYTAAVQECRIKHTIEVWTGSAWSEVTHMRFIGQVLDVEYDDGADADNNPAQKTASITCEQHGIWSTFRRVFRREDGEEELIDDPAGLGKYFLTVV